MVSPSLKKQITFLLLGYYPDLSIGKIADNTFTILWVIIVLILNAGGEICLISYEPLMKTMAEQGATTYTLKVKGGVSSASIRRIKAGESITLHTVDLICKVLHCDVCDVVCFIDDSDDK